MSWQKQKKELEKDYSFSNTGIAMNRIDRMLGHLYDEYEDKNMEEILDLVQEIIEWEKKHQTIK